MTSTSGPDESNARQRGRAAGASLWLVAGLGMLGGCLLCGLAAAGISLAPVPTEEIAPRVYLGDLGGAYGANQVFIIYDQFVVVFDPGRVPHARRLVNSIRARTDKPIRYVITSHFHPDHAAGAAVFAPLGAEIVADAGCRRHFEDWGREDFARKIESDPDTYGDLVYSPPTRYIDGPWTIDDGSQRLELVHYGPAHTDCDLIGWMPDYRVLFAGDLSTNGQHNLAGADTAGWISVLDHLQALEPDVVVPGHLRPAGPEILSKSQRYLVELRRQVQEMLDRDMAFDEILGAVEIPFYETWSGVRVRDEEGNVNRVYWELGGKREKSILDTILEHKRLAALLGLAGVLAGVAAFWYLRRRLDSDRLPQATDSARASAAFTSEGLP